MVKGKKTVSSKELVQLTKEMFHRYFSGDLTLWFSHLCEDSVWIGSGEPILFGKNAIEKRFKNLQGMNLPVLHENYHLVSFSENAGQVCGQYLIGRKNHSLLISVHFSMGFRMLDGEWNIILQHQSHNYTQIRGSKAETSVEIGLNTLHFINDLLINQHFTGKRISVRSGTQLITVATQSILYVQSHKNKAELICVDKTVPCNMSLGQLAKILPKEFYPVHRCYWVNTRYILALRRFEVELPFGITLSVPAKRYKQIKADLEKMLQ